MIFRMTEGTLRRAIRAGTVTAEQRRRNPDSQTDLRMVYEVLVNDPPASAAPPESNQPPDTNQESPAALLGVLADLTATHERLYEAYREIADLRERAASAEAAAGHERARADDLAERLAASEARLALLASELIEAQHTADQRAQALEWVQVQLDRERARRPWWRRLFR